MSVVTDSLDARYRTAWSALNELTGFHEAVPEALVDVVRKRFAELADLQEAFEARRAAAANELVIPGSVGQLRMMCAMGFKSTLSAATMHMIGGIIDDNDRLQSELKAAEAGRTQLQGEVRTLAGNLEYEQGMARRWRDAERKELLGCIKDHNRRWGRQSQTIGELRAELARVREDRKKLRNLVVEMATEVDAKPQVKGAREPMRLTRGPSRVFGPDVSGSGDVHRAVCSGCRNYLEWSADQDEITCPCGTHLRVGAPATLPGIQAQEAVVSGVVRHGVDFGIGPKHADPAPAPAPSAKSKAMVMAMYQAGWVPAGQLEAAALYLDAAEAEDRNGTHRILRHNCQMPLSLEEGAIHECRACGDQWSRTDGFWSRMRDVA